VAGGSCRKASAYDDPPGIPAPSICRRKHGASAAVRHVESMHATERSQASSVMGALAPPHDRSVPLQGCRLVRVRTEHGAPPPRRTRASTQVRAPRRSHASRGEEPLEPTYEQRGHRQLAAAPGTTRRKPPSPPHRTRASARGREEATTTKSQGSREAEQATGKSGEEERKGIGSR
jgi:hypothetical protein